MAWALARNTAPRSRCGRSWPNSGLLEQRAGPRSGRWVGVDDMTFAPGVAWRMLHKAVSWLFALAILNPLLMLPAQALAAEPTTRMVYITLDKPDPDRGALKLVRHDQTSSQQVAPNTTLVTTLYDEVCTEPCGIEVDITERPKFFFLRDGVPVSYAFRIPAGEGPVTFKVRPFRKGLVMGGMYLVAFIVGLPAGIPMLVYGASKVWMSSAPIDQAIDFTKVKKAK